MAGSCTTSQLNPGGERIFQLSEIKNFPDRGATNPAANGFKFGALVNLHAHTDSFPALHSNEAAYQAYSKRVRGVTS